MLRVVFRVLKFSGSYANRLKLSFLLSFIEGILQNIPIVAIWLIIKKILDNQLITNDAYSIGTILLISISIRMLLRYWFVSLESGAGYEICERERILLGDRLRHFPMRYFNESHLGHITAIITVDLPFIEEMGMDALDKVISGYCSIVIGCILLFTVDLRIGLLTLVIFIMAYYLFTYLEKVSIKQSPIRQQKQTELVSKILEYVQGISVIKAFHLGGSKARHIQEAIESTKDHSIAYEVALLQPVLLFKCCFGLGTAVTIMLAAILSVQGELPVFTAIALFIFVFNIYTPATAFASLSSQLRVMEAGLNRYESLKQEPLMEEGEETLLKNNYDIVFEDVSFAYEKENILEHINIEIPEKTITALVGPSGGGKTTIANLIVRFWDTQKGSITLGGKDIKDLNSDALLANISMVFQNVYLFNDTVMNNIRFSKPSASKEEIMEVAKKARCHDFITELSEGYETIIGENGSSLSGGERQRISIARAMLKDAPIIILDEATASIDPDNEADIQIAIGELIKNKTLIMIAHRLSTIKNADQILFIENKQIVESGTHDELIEKQGRYYDLWTQRVKAGGWKIKKN